MENEQNQQNQFTQIEGTKPSKFGFLSTKLKSFLRECFRVLQLTKKPTKEEFKIIIKVSLIGIAIIGLIGFMVQLLSYLVKGF
ncbi:protein translocase SEC61 complex subunit gamma [Candidatus Woesearchaeota archaeon]|nr:protein translocase SEC61 complex subunit gamma [Candidatus Woesearchaeota archaeon]